ncbi:MAG: YajD family HNH nuclease [Desulfomonilia bacterium]|jgi:5-methylcytosine-specific restriction endonuclease McrA|nr:YajD family HNH nuclease [Desulfomonilia bacterium]HPW68520.1 YajD family HNH nuclease [Deltaproteobacteria bacterium]
MPHKKPGTDSGRLGDFSAEVRRSREQREKGYREQALRLFPWVCARCGRELSGRKLRELTVHHKDHNHDNNPPDGSNWELLCVYCHDIEHSRDVDGQWYGEETRTNEPGASHTYKAFAGLDALLKGKKDR